MSKQPRKKAILCNFGTGGHTEQMTRLLSHVEFGDLILIAQSPTSKITDERYGEYSKILKVREDYARVFGIDFLKVPFSIITGIFRTVRLFLRFDIRMLISTGSGVAIIPSVIAKLFGAKVIFFESWCRFSVPSISGRIMYRVADVFFVQNEEIKKHYRTALYMGQL